MLFRDADEWLGGFHDPECVWFHSNTCTCGSVAGSDDDREEDISDDEFELFYGE